MNGLGLFAGIGGLELGLHLVDADYRTVCFVEKEEFPQRVLSHRFPCTPIWDDVVTFDGRPWFGDVDIITAGFPCQPFSSAARGRNRGESMWPHAQRVVLEVRPKFVFVENVSAAPWDQVEQGLRDDGFDTASRVFCSSEVGAPHRRRRRFLLASHPDRHCEPLGPVDEEVACLQSPPEPDDFGSGGVRVSDGPSNRMDRLRACGNAVVPEMAAAAFKELKEKL